MKNTPKYKNHNKIGLLLQEKFAIITDRFFAIGLKRLVGLSIVIAGLCTVVYAIVIPMYNSYLNDQRVDEVRNAISGLLRDDTKKEDTDNYLGTGMTQKEYEALSVSDKSRIDAQIRKEKLAMATVSDQNIIGIIEIDALNIMYAVVEGTKNINIKASIGHISSTSAMGNDGTCILAGHRGGIYGEMFDNVDKLNNGDIIKLTDLNGTEYSYEVYDRKTIKSRDWSIANWIDNQITLVLLTCESGGSTRLCIMCRMVDINTDDKGSQIINIITPTTTQAPTPEPTPTPTDVPRDKKYHVKLTNEFGNVLIDQDTDEEGNWSYNWIEGTYMIEYKYSNGDFETIQKVVGSGRASRVSKILVTDLEERIVYIGETDGEGNYDLTLPDGDYIITFTDAFGTKTVKDIHVGN